MIATLAQMVYCTETGWDGVNFLHCSLYAAVF